MKTSKMNPVEAAIRAEFPGNSNKGVRALIRTAANADGDGKMLSSVSHLASRVALTACGKASLDAVRTAQLAYESELY